MALGDWLAPVVVCSVVLVVCVSVRKCAFVASDVKVLLLTGSNVHTLGSLSVLTVGSW